MGENSADPMPVCFDDVSFAYVTGEALLRHFTLTVEPGEIVAIVGRSGAGKSTMLKLVNRMLLPSDGKVFVEGRETRDWDPIALRRRIGYVFQDVGLFPHMTVEQNVSVVPRLERWPDDRARDRANELLELVGLSPGV